jgi:hypothetical protein
LISQLKLDRSGILSAPLVSKRGGERQDRNRRFKSSRMPPALDEKDDATAHDDHKDQDP